MKEKEWEETDFDEEDSICPNCGQSTEGETTCPYCGAILVEDEDIDTFEDEEEF